MKLSPFLSVMVLAALFSSEAESEPVDLTGLTCVRDTQFGPNTWDFYGDVAVRAYSANQGRPQRYVRIGKGAYERYSRLDGEWDAIYYFFDAGDGIHVRVHSRPGLIVRENNPKASWDRFMFAFAADCQPLWVANQNQ